MKQMTEYEKMLSGMQFDYTDAEIQARIKQTYYAMRDFNQCGAWDMDELRRCQQALLRMTSRMMWWSPVTRQE